MGQLTPSFLIDLETRMRLISTNEYQRLLANLWWSRVTKADTSTGRKERLIWLLDTAQIEYTNALGGEVSFDDLLSFTFEYETKAAAAGLELNRYQLDDHDGGGVQLAAAWSRQIGSYAAYWPQKQVAALIRNGDQSGSTCYDGQLFFSTAHPVNPFDSSVGTFANVFTGAASGAYPGALDLTDAVSVDVALANLGKAIAYVEGIKMPNGEDPRGLRVSGIMGPPRMAARLQQLTNAKLIAQAASSGGGSGDVEAVVRNWGLGQPINAPELGAGFTNGSDSSVYLVVDDPVSDELGGLLYSVRDPFEVVFNGHMTDAQLARANKLQWMTRGRNVAVYGHPYRLFKLKTS